jgi:acyl-CoA thioesterase
VADAPTRFDRDTAVAPVVGEPGVYAARIDPGWRVIRGPNGGYLAAILLRALAAAVADPARAPRSLTVHYTRPPAEAPVRIETRVERAGRSLTTLSARLLQAGEPCALALAAFSAPRPGFELADAVPPEVPPPEACQPIPPGRMPIALRERFDQRWAIGAQPFTGGSEAMSGGWIRLAEPRRIDALALAAFADSFPPAIFSSAGPEAELGPVPTIDLTIHFRSELPLPGARPDDFALCVFRTGTARDGFCEEDGEIWSARGELLAHSRQLALAGGGQRPAPGRLGAKSP